MRRALQGSWTSLGQSIECDSPSVSRKTDVKAMRFRQLIDGRACVARGSIIASRRAAQFAFAAQSLVLRGGRPESAATQSRQPCLGARRRADGLWALGWNLALCGSSHHHWPGRPKEKLATRPAPDGETRTKLSTRSSDAGAACAWARARLEFGVGGLASSLGDAHAPLRLIGFTAFTGRQSRRRRCRGPPAPDVESSLEAPSPCPCGSAMRASARGSDT